MQPGIFIDVHSDAVRIRQQRPPVLTALQGQHPERALALVPRLLPICGVAQSVAGERALAAARGQAPDLALERANGPAVLREQALSAAWRLTIDWPELVGGAPELERLKAVRQAGDPEELGAALATLLPGLAADSDRGAVQAFIDDSDCVAARVLRAASDSPRADGPAAPRVTGKELVELAGEALAVDDFDPLAPGDGAADVGPLAMARAPLTRELAAADTVGVRERLLAQVLDTAVIAEALQAGQAPTEPVATSVAVGNGVGLGSAVTARGPVFHRVILGADGQVESWRSVAPTDWHFAPRGPVVRGLPAQRSSDAMRRLVASFDPCAAWELAVGGDAD